MPLKKGSSNKTVNFNVEKLVKEGRKREQAVVIALDKAGRSRKDRRKK